MLKSAIVRNISSFVLAAALGFSVAAVASGQRAAAPRHAGESLARTPPMGWNSWDGYGTTIDEKEFRLNADWFAKHLKPYG